MNLWLRAIPPELRDQATKAFEKGNARGFLSCADAGAALAIVFDNYPQLRERGIFEEALFYAYTGAKSNFLGWTLEAIQFLFDYADQDKIQSLGTGLPGNGPFKVYRGVAGKRGKRNVRGFSWTPSLNIACWFALRFECFGVENPGVYEAILTRDEVYFYTEERDEEEFVGRPKGRPKLVDIPPDEMRTAFDRVAARWKK